MSKVTIEKLSHELRGISSEDGKKIFIKGALPGEIVTFVQTRKKTTYQEGYASEVHKPHPERITPICPKADALKDPHPCGGCAVQYMPQAMQLNYKQQVVAELLAHIVKPDAWQAPITSQAEGYRSKARLGVRFNKKANQVHVGFREARSHFIAKTDKCPILHKAIGPHLHAIGEAIAQTSVADSIPQIEVAVGDSSCALVLRHLKPMSANDLDIMRSLCTKHNWQLWLQSSNYDSVYCHYCPTEEKQLLSYKLPAQSIELFFHPIDFTQVNLNVNRKLVSQALAWLNPSKQDIVFDLFSGIGNFSIALATMANKVFAVEGDAKLSQRCQENASINQQEIATYTMDLMPDKDLVNFVKLYKKEKPNLLLLDPPRTGCLELIEELSMLKHIERILYISCNPHTLARDASTLTANGFEIKKISIADMFAHTTHVETMCLFARTT